MQTPWEHCSAQRVQRMSSSAIRELLKLTTQSEIISFAGGLPAREVFPVAKFAEASTRVLKEFGAQALQYSTTDGASFGLLAMMIPFWSRLYSIRGWQFCQ